METPQTTQNAFDFTARPARFSGPVYDEHLDAARLTGQLLRIAELMADQEWRTLGEISELTGDSTASISAQLRHLRKPRFGSNKVNKRRRGEPGSGCWEYQVVMNVRTEN